MAEKRLRLLKFGADYCGPCRSMARARTLERFAEKHPDIALEVVDIDADEKRADAYDFRGIPAFVFEDMEGNIVFSDEGATNEAGLEKMYQKALRALDAGDFGSVRRRKRKKAKATEVEDVEDDTEEDSDEGEDDPEDG